MFIFNNKHSVIYLFSPVFVSQNYIKILQACQMQQNKPVLLSPAYYYGKKKSKRVGRPPGGHSNLEGGVKRRGRKRKRRKQLFVHKKRRSSASVDNTPAGSPQVTHTHSLH